MATSGLWKKEETASAVTKLYFTSFNSIQWYRCKVTPVNSLLRNM